MKNQKKDRMNKIKAIPRIALFGKYHIKGK